MQTHEDSDARREFMTRLRTRADQNVAAGRSQITGGRPGEEPLDEWEHGGIQVRQMPEDEQGILRISVGGGEDTPVEVNYCVFRGSRAKCADLLRKALAALVQGVQ